MKDTAHVGRTSMPENYHSRTADTSHIQPVNTKSRCREAPNPIHAMTCMFHVDSHSSVRHHAVPTSLIRRLQATYAEQVDRGHEWTRVWTGQDGSESEKHTMRIRSYNADSLQQRNNTCRTEPPQRQALHTGMKYRRALRSSRDLSPYALKPSQSKAMTKAGSVREKDEREMGIGLLKRQESPQ